MAELAAPAAPQPPVRRLPVDATTLTRLHGLACITCGRAGVPLSPAGHVYTCDGSGGLLGWPVAACPEHPGGPIQPTTETSPETTAVAVLTATQDFWVRVARNGLEHAAALLREDVQPADLLLCVNSLKANLCAVLDVVDDLIQRLGAMP